MDRRQFLRLTGAAAFMAAAVGGIATVTADETPEVVLWDSHAPVLNQGDIGSCTGNAVTQMLNTDYAMKLSGRTTYLAEDEALKIYTLATEDDNFPGNYPQQDTGSTGAFACQAAIQLGFLSGYQCVGPTLPELLAALRKQPLIVGCDWNSDMDNPAPDGLVSVGGDFRGGHEFALLGFDVGTSEFTFLNSWSNSWAANGRFKIKFDDFVTLLAGDLSAVNAPAVKPAA